MHSLEFNQEECIFVVTGKLFVAQPVKHCYHVVSCLELMLHVPE